MLTPCFSYILTKNTLTMYFPIIERSDETMRKFASGFVTGTLAAAAVVAGVVMGVKKNVIDPIEEKESKIDENRKKARRKRIAR